MSYATLVPSPYAGLGGDMFETAVRRAKLGAEVKLLTQQLYDLRLTDKEWENFGIIYSPKCDPVDGSTEAPCADWVKKAKKAITYKKEQARVAKHPKAPPPPPPLVMLAAIPPGSYPGVDAASVELRTRGTVGGGVPRGFASAAQVVRFMQCMNAKFPAGFPSQTKETRAAQIATARFHCALESGVDASSSSAPAADATLALLRPSIRINAAVLDRIKKSTAPTIPLLRLPSGLVKPVTEVEPSVAATATPATASPSTEAAAADEQERALFGLPPSTLLMGGVAIAAVAVAAFSLGGKRLSCHTRELSPAPTPTKATPVSALP